MLWDIIRMAIGSIFGAFIHWVSQRKGSKEDKQEREKDREKITELELELLTQGEVSDLVAKYMRQHPDSEVYHYIKTSSRATKLTNIEDAMLYARAERKKRGLSTTRIKKIKPEAPVDED